MILIAAFVVLFLSQQARCQSNIFQVSQYSQSPLGISCTPNNTLIMLHQVTYGRLDFYCQDSQAYQKLSSLCDLKTSCNFNLPYTPSMHLPCPGLTQRLQLTYECIPPSSSKLRQSFRKLVKIGVDSSVTSLNDIDLSGSTNKENDCLEQCDSNKDCVVAVISLDGICSIYDKNANDYATSYKATSSLYQKRQNGRFPTLRVFAREYDQWLQNYWPIDNSLYDVIDASKRLISDNPTLVADRQGRAYSAFMVTDLTDYMFTSPGVFFTTDFTIMLWVNFVQHPVDQNWQIVMIDFGLVGQMNQNAFFYLRTDDNMLRFSIDGSNYDLNVYFNHNQWYHLAVTVQGTILCAYVNGKVAYTRNDFTRYRVYNRTTNFIGKTSWFHDADYDIKLFDDIKIFSRVLSLPEINNHYALTDSYVKLI